MNVLYLIAGLLFGIGLMGQMGDIHSYWAMLIIPAGLTFAISIVMETNGK